MQQQMTGALSVLLVSTLSWGDPCPGDLNGDGLRDQLDLGILLTSYGQDAGGDIDGDGDTDQSDLLLLLANYHTDCLDPPAMVVIPAGEFQMGDHNAAGYHDELPVHDVYIDSFSVDIYEVTNEEYTTFLNIAYPYQITVVDGIVYGVADTEYDDPYCDTYSYDDDSRIHWDGSTFIVASGKENHPMTEVSWYGAAAYANWRSTEQGLQPSYDLDKWECDFTAGGYRLLTEAEWEYAARGGEHDPYYKYPWGNDIDGSEANYAHSGDPYESGPHPWTTPVGYYDGNQTPPGVDMANGYGLYDMTGNVYEWCNDWYDEDYYNSSPYDNPKGPKSGSHRVLRGGSWNYWDYDVRCAIRRRQLSYRRIDDFGVRLALD